MRMKRNIYICLGLILGALLQIEAQPSNSLYFMNGVPQANRVNPARQPACGFYIGMPLLSPLSTELSSSSLAWKDIIYPHPSEDSLIYFLHPEGDQQAFLKKLKPLNYVISDLGTSIFSMGFRTAAGFFSLDLTSRVDGNLYYPGDLARLVLNGADEGETYTMNGMGTNLSVYDEIALGWSGAIGDKLQIGVRGKLLFGVGNLNTTNSQLEVNTSELMWDIESDMEFDVSLPFAEVVYNDEGMIEDVIMDEDIENLNPLAIARLAFNKRNLGLGLDLGVDYRPSERWHLSASVLDLGYIRWSDEVHELSYKTSFDYNSQEVNPFDFIDDTGEGIKLDSIVSELADTLSGALVFTPGEIYSRRLHSKLFVGASWYVTPKINFGLLSRTDFLKATVVEQVSASANFAAGRFLNFTLSYSYINSYFKNIGAGVSFNAGPLNLYLISDNTLNLVFWPEEAHSANLWFGMNLVFGYKQFVRDDGDRPLVY
jgi:Family of unknown function (DUF5723)